MRLQPVSRGRGQAGCARAPPLAWQPFYLPGMVLVSALGQVIPLQKSLMRKSLEMGAQRGLVQVQDDQTKTFGGRPKAACASCKANRWPSHAESGERCFPVGAGEVGSLERGAAECERPAPVRLSQPSDSERSGSGAAAKHVSACLCGVCAGLSGPLRSPLAPASSSQPGAGLLWLPHSSGSPRP